MLGLFMFGISAAVTPPLAALFGEVESAVPMGLLMTGTAATAGVVFALGRSRSAAGAMDGFEETSVSDPDHVPPLTASATV